MATTAVASSTGPRYAPFDPTLPKPWRGLIDGKSGYLYFWNPVTNITQYERPSSDPIPDQSIRPDPPKSEVTSQGFDCDLEDLYRGNCSNSLSTGSPAHQGSSGAGNQAQNILNYNGSNVGTSTCFDIRLDESADSYRQKHEITVTGSDVPHPFTTFKSAGFPLEILREVRYLLLEEPMSYTVGPMYCWSASYGGPIFSWPSKSPDTWLGLLVIQKVGFSDPTPIQAQSWPIALKKCDIVAVAKTGSGKTLGYLIPSFIHLKRCRNNPQLGPTVLVLSPTRELATQIHEEAVKFGKSSRISSTCLYGGAPKGPQLRDLDRGSDVVVATPGRLNDILEMKRISLNQVSYLVLDEADRMLDMGFEPQIRKIVEAVPTRRQTLMFTATWPKEVRKIAADLLVNPVQVNIGNADVLVANKSITQHVEVVFPTEKQCRLEQILRSQGLGSKVIVFCSTKRMCDQLAHKLTRQFGVAVIHGDKSQSERDYVLNQFRTGDSPILIATDVAARGLDVKDIRAVVNYDFPTGIEDYVHRIGRTGRAGATGVAYTFFCEQDSKYASDLIKILEESNQKVPPQLRDLALRGCGDRTSRVRSRWPSNHSDFSNRNLSNYNGGSGRNLQRSDSPDRDHQRKGQGDNQEYPDWSTCSYHEQHAARAHTRNHTRRSRSRSIERRQF